MFPLQHKATDPPIHPSWKLAVSYSLCLHFGLAEQRRQLGNSLYRLENAASQSSHVVRQQPQLGTSNVTLTRRTLEETLESNKPIVSFQRRVHQLLLGNNVQSSSQWQNLDLNPVLLSSVVIDLVLLGQYAYSYTSPFPSLSLHVHIPGECIHVYTCVYMSEVNFQHHSSRVVRHLFSQDGFSHWSRTFPIA